MEDKKDEVIKILEKVEVELTFLTTVITYMGIDSIELNSDDILGVSSLLNRVKEDVKESVDILS